MPRSRLIVSLLALACLGLLASGTSGQENTAVREAGKRRAEAQVTFNKAQQAVNIIAQRIRSQFESKQEWIAAENERKTAQKNLDQALAPVRDKVRGSEEYKALVEQKAKADEDLARLRDRRTDPAQLTVLATKSVDLSSQMSKMEFDAVSADAKVTESKKALAAANAKLAELRQVADDAMRGDPEWQEAKKQSDEAQTKLADATKQVQDAQKSAADAARSAAASKNPPRSRSRSGSGSRGY